MSPTDLASRPDAPARARAQHWRRTQRLTLALLAAWFGVGFVVTWFARDLDFPFFGWPFSFWVAAQGGMLVFVGLLVVYAMRMARVDRSLARDGGPPEGASRPGDGGIAAASSVSRRRG